jgi:putative spermidine/putrescine transport system substrate-binding protein
MKKGKSFLCVLLTAAMAMSALTGCGGSTSKTEETTGGTAKEVEVDPDATVELNGTTMPLSELVANALQEGDVESVGMPDDWADWKDSWESINSIYGITHSDIDMTSAEELAQFAAEKDDPTKDVGDIGLAMTPEAISQDVVGSFKASTWDSFPDWAKDSEGRWIMTYTGSIAFIANTEYTGGSCPTSWADVKEGDYLVSVGNVLGGAASQVAVLSCAIANGGSLDNVQPGIDFFKELAAEGRLDTGDTTSARLASGEMVCCVGNYDYSVLAWRDNILAENPDMQLDITIPSDGSVTNGYCQIINKYALHPNAAALAIEYLCSDDAAIERAKGYARPTKQDVVLPDDVAASLLSDDLYTNCTNITDVEALNAACAEIADLWEREVLPLVQ